MLLGQLIYNIYIYIYTQYTQSKHIGNMYIDHIDKLDNSMIYLPKFKLDNRMIYSLKFRIIYLVMNNLFSMHKRTLRRISKI